MSKIETVGGTKVRIHFDAELCIHSRGCVLARPDVFVPNVAGEWIHPDAATPEAVAELAHQCPSGAITYERLDGGPVEVPPKVNLARVRENGPLAFHGELIIAGQAPCLRATLCRCGAAKNKPFCDGSHAAANFIATGEVPAKDSTPLATRNGPLAIKPATNGPLLVSGPVEVVTGTGKTVNRSTGAAFCRCGQSANKPYCDGTHAKVGFKAPGA
ncbi:MAG: CDGSH iron-sulfur domain-containing protein [Burkholderiales bacterium]